MMIISSTSLTRLWVIVSICFLGSSNLLAQSSSNSKLLLRSGIKSLPENARQFIENPDWQAAEADQNRYYRLLQFAELPSETDKQAMAAQGFQLLQYFPHFSYLTAISPTANLRLLGQWQVRSVYTLQAVDKLHPQLVSGEVPDYALKDDQVEVMVLTYPGTVSGQAISSLARQGFPLTDHPGQANVLVLQLPLEKVWELASLPFVSYVEPNTGPGEPEDTRGRSLHRSNVINTAYAGGRKYDGTGVSVQVRDDGAIGPHIDYQGRLNLNYVGGTGGGTHGDGVGGIFAGAGNLNPTNAGMASGALVYATQYDQSFTDVTLSLHQNEQVMVTNSSYSDGCNAGYTAVTQRVDEQMFENPGLIHVFSAGNSNNQNCGYGAGNQWGNITGGHKMGKNVIATANLFADDGLVNSSSRGPAHDGRLKPDIAANGQNQISTAPNNGYLTFGGTSGAAPGIAGVAAQLIHAYRELNAGQDPASPLVKSAMLNTAYDLGNAGPDFKYGWGRIDANRALSLLEEGRYFSASIGNGGANTHTLSIPANVKAARVMVYWMDPPAAPGAAKALINNLDFSLTDMGGAVSLPLILDHTPNVNTLNAPAVPGIDSLNNVEQVVLSDPAAGTYTLNIQGTEVPEGPQEYYVVYDFYTDEVSVTYPLGGEGFAPGSTERIHWDAYGNDQGPFTLEYTTDNGASWQVINAAFPASARHFNWQVPALLSGEARVRVSRAGISDESDANFSIIGQAQNLNIERVCPNSTTLSWNAVVGATGYEVFLLGEKYMDSVMVVGASPNPEAVINGIDPSGTEWLAVRATGPTNAKGLRSLAIERPPGRLNCDIDNDLGLTSLNVQGGSFLRSCYSDVLNVVINVENAGNISLTGFSLNYQLANEPAISETFAGNLAALDNANFTFSTPLSAQSSGVLSLKTWVSWPMDTVSANDSSEKIVVIYPGETAELPLQEDFEDFATCDSVPNCEGESCELIQGWYNVPNGFGDDVDWRVLSGDTPTENTGPDRDHSPGTHDGQYLYLESSGDCGGRFAYLLSPCLDLSAATSPELRFWTHAYGSGIGGFFVDIYRGNGQWQLFASPPVFGNQGNEWQETVINLTPFAGELITLRIRGLISGDGEYGDLALDDFAIYDRAAGPLADFGADRRSACVDSRIELQDLSLNSPTSWEWRISPSAIFLNGTSSASSNPVVSFSTAGSYEVQLIVSNGAGSDSLIQSQYLEIGPGEGINWSENFELPAFPPILWERENPDMDRLWMRSSQVGITGQATLVARMPNFDYAEPGTEDILTSPVLDLRGADQPWLYLDLAYGGGSDLFRILLSQDCGETFSEIIYEKLGLQLSTLPSSPAADRWKPDSAQHWRTDSVSLSDFAGESVQLKFVNLNSNGTSSNDLYLDNIRVEERGMGQPTANFSSSAQQVCEGESVLFTDLSGGAAATSYQWDFGPGATPAAATTAGPHTVSYEGSGLITVSLEVGNAVGSTSLDRQVSVSPLPSSDYSVAISGLTYSFTTLSQDADAYLWDFGDGNSSTDLNPVHTYASPGFYTVELITSNDCGQDSFSQSLVGMADLISGAEIQLFPNPSAGRVELQVSAQQLASWKLELLDVRGKSLHRWVIQPHALDFRETLDVSSLPQGLYLMQVQANGQQQYLKLMIQH